MNYLGIGVIHISHTHANEASQTGHFARHISSAHALLDHGCRLAVACSDSKQQGQPAGGPKIFFQLGGMHAELSLKWKQASA